MTEIGCSEARTHFSQILERVRNGEEFTITKRGVAIARLSLVSNTREEEIRKAIQDIEELAARNTLGGIKIRELIEEGRRW